MSLVSNSNPPKNLSPASSNMNDSDASRYAHCPYINAIYKIITIIIFPCSFSFKDSNFSYDAKQPSDDSTNLSFSISQ